MRRIITAVLFFCLVHQSSAQKLRVAVAGIEHGHVGWILGRKADKDIELVGVYSENIALARQYATRYGFPDSLIHENLGEMLDLIKPQALLGFGSVFSHLSVVEAAAPRKIPVMLEKPLAVSIDHATKIQKLAQRYKIHVLTNYETSWYPSVAKSFQLVQDSAFVGNIRKVVIHDGHEGPKEIGCSPEFLAWLTDSTLNGGGAITDFGCYGANLMTRLTNGEKPIAITAVTRHFKPHIYPNVDDDATIIVDYPSSQCIIQASWNWPYSRKDMEIYGDKGYIFAPDKQTLLRGTNTTPTRHTITAKDIPVYEDPFLYLRDVIFNKVKPLPFDVYSLDNNMIVMKILEAAKESARTGKKVTFR